jgi:16S rRNA (guanine527-N7)-methyltransferase
VSQAPRAGTAVAESPPADAEAVFGERLPLASRYAHLLTTAAVQRGLLGPREPARIWTRHLLNSAAVAAELPCGAVSVLDIGSGAGLPGIPVWLARPDVELTLVESMRRRVEFLRETVADLGLPTRVVHGRAESLPAASFDVVVARAVAPLTRLLPLALPLLRPGGRLLALKGDTAAAEIADVSGSGHRRRQVRMRLREVSVAGVAATLVRVDLPGARGAR